MRDREKLYEKRKTRYEGLYRRQTRTANRISNLRLLVFILGTAGLIVLFVARLYILLAAAFLAALFAFGWLVQKHQRVLDNKKHSTLMVQINEDSVKRLKGEWKNFADTGKEFISPEHRYSGDLDIFGEGSLFQFINTAITYTGRKKLARILINPDKTPEIIYARQKAVAETAADLKWRQRLLAEGLAASDRLHDPEALYRWVDERNEFLHKSWFVLLIRILPVLTVLLLLSAYFLPAVPGYIAAVPVLVQFFLIRHKWRDREEIFKTTAKYQDNIRVYDRMLKQVENRRMESECMKDLASRLVNRENLTASQQVARLVKIVDSLSNRYNAFYFVFNVLTLWDFQCLVALERWKEASGKAIPIWLDTLGELETLSSLAILKYDHEDWCFPQVTLPYQGLRAQAVGHPLLGEQRVGNDLAVGSTEKILLITGSNMSGKSTLLRTAGINLVLAYAGAPVCAREFSCSIMEVYTCMRISDDLQKNISSFYAELLRIKEIVRAAGEGEPIFFLLDEIFKGTNSRDRHAGARVLVNKLERQGAVGLVSTHDLELGELEAASSGKIKNYHFEEFYKDNQIYFDYKLRNGISTTRNAVYLMKLAGIDFEEGT